MKSTEFCGEKKKEIVEHVSKNSVYLLTRFM